MEAAKGFVTFVAVFFTIAINSLTTPVWAENGCNFFELMFGQGLVMLGMYGIRTLIVRLIDLLYDNN